MNWGGGIWPMILAGAAFVGLIVWVMLDHDDTHLDPPPR